MKKAKIILTGITVLALIGGAFAFKASSFNLFRIYHPTTAVTTVLSGSTYTFTAPLADPFCTYTVTVPQLFTTAPGEGFVSTYRTTIGASKTTYTIGTATVSFAKSCPTVVANVTTLP